MTGCIVGWAHTPFGRHEGMDVEALMLRAIDAALNDATLSWWWAWRR